MQVYFKSLNKIEDTIKFMEENIIGDKNRKPLNKKCEEKNSE